MERSSPSTRSTSIRYQHLPVGAPWTHITSLIKDSPLNDLCAMELQCNDLEVTVILEGVVETTGMTWLRRSSVATDSCPIANKRRGHLLGGLLKVLGTWSKLPPLSWSFLCWLLYLDHCNVMSGTICLYLGYLDAPSSVQSQVNNSTHRSNRGPKCFELFHFWSLPVGVDNESTLETKTESDMAYSWVGSDFQWILCDC